MEEKELLIDNHIVELEYKSNVVKVYFYYNNNLNCTDFLYDIEEKSFFAFSNNNFLTSRQEKLLKRKIEKFIKKLIK